METGFIGIDVGTQGVRASVVTDTGVVLAEASRKFVLTPESRMEQSPDDWWSATLSVMDELHKELLGLQDTVQVISLAVDSTSGTVIPLDGSNRPLHPAIMYSDPRAAGQGRRCSALAEQYIRRGYTGFNASSGLSKMLWFVETYPEKASGIHKWIHASDYITGKLCGRFDVTDYTNALKSGYDVEGLSWPEYLTAELPLQADWLQEVVPSGTPIAPLDETLASRWAMRNAQVVVGLTDGCASQLASGAVKPGEWNTTIGTTLVIKGVTKQRVLDPEGRLYSHRHPEGYWMPGGASNTGADWVATDFGTNVNELEQEAAQTLPTGLLAWPLKQRGERFPFLAPEAEGFLPSDVSQGHRFGACMEGVAYIERMAYELIEQLSGERVSAVYTAGGGSNNDTWVKIRANVLNRPVYKCRETSGSVGAAICAASKTRFGSVAEATARMTTIEQEILPEPKLAERYQAEYHRFVSVLKQKNYI